MSRRRAAIKRVVLPDAKHGNVVFTKFINSLMYNGKKSAAETIVYGALDSINKRTSQDPLPIFTSALENVMPSVEVRKRVTIVEDIFHEGGPVARTPYRRAAILSVIKNPFAGRYVEDLAPLIEIGEELGELLANRAVAALGIEGPSAESYGKAAAVGQFGSGWAWLILASDGKLKVTKTPNGSNPLATGEGKALLACDVWEHSYYLDFRNRRPDYVQNWLDKIANYEFAEGKL